LLLEIQSQKNSVSDKEFGFSYSVGKDVADLARELFDLDSLAPGNPDNNFRGKHAKQNPFGFA